MLGRFGDQHQAHCSQVLFRGSSAKPTPKGAAGGCTRTQRDELSAPSRFDLVPNKYAGDVPRRPGRA
jgi:hypothetical protein